MVALSQIRRTLVYGYLYHDSEHVLRKLISYTADIVAERSQAKQVDITIKPDTLSKVDRLCTMPTDGPPAASEVDALADYLYGQYVGLWRAFNQVDLYDGAFDGVTI